MKNENYLKRIAIALETLVSQGNSLSAEFIEEVKEPTKVGNDDVKPAVVEYTKPTHADLKGACLISARDKSENRDKLKALLKEYGALKAVDVDIKDLTEVISRINKGDF